LPDYDYYLFVDDDILLDPPTIGGIFKVAVDYNLELCQPSLSEDSVTDWPLLKPGGFLFLHVYNRKWLSVTELWFKKVQCVDRLTMFTWLDSPGT